MDRKARPSGPEQGLSRILIIRHGSYDGPRGPLNELGRRQIAQLGRQIKPLLSGLRVRIYSSGLMRAWTSAEVLALQLGLESSEIEKTACLEPDFLGNAEPESALECLLSCSGDYAAVIAVTHLQYLDVLPQRIQEIWHGDKGPELSRGIDWACLKLDSVEYRAGRYKVT